MRSQCEGEVMGEWKTQLSLRVSQEFRREFEAFAEKREVEAEQHGQRPLDMGV